jgi:two-component system cell cycle response regulator
LGNILVVDDEQCNRELLEAILAQDGHAVRLAADGPVALVAAREDPPDLVLLDLMMPGMSGLEVCQHLKADPATATAPVIVVTMLGECQVKAVSLALGADDFLAKPLRLTDVLTRVTAMLRVRGIRHDLDRTFAYMHELQVSRRVRGRGGRVSGEAGAPPHIPTACQVLLVEDDPLARQFYGDLLTEHGFRVTQAAGGEAALGLAAQGPFDVVVLDLVMPGTSGLDILARLREMEPDRPVLMRTGYVTSQNAIAALRLGAFDLLVKGLDPALVVLAVHRALRYRRELVARERELSGLRERMQAGEEPPGARQPAIPRSMIALEGG